MAACSSINRSNAYTFDGVISGAGSFVQMGAGTTTLTATNTYTGGTTISGGTLAVSTDANLGDTSGGLSFGRCSILRASPRTAT